MNGKAGKRNEHKALPVRQTTNRSRAAETLETGAPGDQEAAHALDAEVEKQACEAEPYHSMNVTDDLEPVKVLPYISQAGRSFYVLAEGVYRQTHEDGSTGTITVKPGASMTIWTQSTIERV